MTIYLYVKTHNITGLKYLGKTIKDPYKYKGSGKEWLLHLSNYGNDVSTKVICVCDSQADLGYWGRYYSSLWKVVSAMDDYGNKIWANCIPETGAGVGRSPNSFTIEEKTTLSLRMKSDMNPSKIPENKKKISDSHWSKIHPEVKEKVSGDNHYSKKPGYESKLKGANNPFSDPIIVNKAKSTFIKLYGVDNPMKSSEIVAKVSGDMHYSRKNGFVSPIIGESHYTKKPGWISKTSGLKHYTKNPEWNPTCNNKNYDHTVYEWFNLKTQDTVHATRQCMMKNYNLKPSSTCSLIKGTMSSYKGWTIKK